MFLNEIFGVLGFGLALGALGTQSPQFYAQVVFLLSLYVPMYYKKRHIIKILRDKKHHLLSMRNIGKSAGVYVLGFGFLLMVALGVLKSNTTWSNLL